MARPRPDQGRRHRCAFQVGAWVLLGLLLIQLVLGSAVRHSQSALAIPDWPFHYGQVVPPMSQPQIDDAIAGYTAGEPSPRFDLDGDGTYQAWQVHTHFTHRLGAYITFVFGIWLVAYVYRSYWARPAVVRPALLVGAILLAQVTLGVFTVLSGERPSVATLHQSNGALLLAAATWLAIRLHLEPGPDSLSVGAGHAKPAAGASGAPASPRETEASPA